MARTALLRGLPFLIPLFFNHVFSLADINNIGCTISSRQPASDESNSNRTAFSSSSALPRPSPRVHSGEGQATPSGIDLILPQKESKDSKTHRTRATRTVVSGGNADSLRRIRSEWRSVVESGIAYHWKRGRPIRSTKSASLSPSHMWLGPLDDRNLYVWHFTIVGLPGSPYDSGLYHGRITLPRSYPLQPPRVQMWTESGRFVPRMDICLSASAYHPETWSPNHWNLRTLVEGLRLHMATTAFEVGGMNAPYEQRIALAAASLKWKVNVHLASGGAVAVDHEKMIKQGLFDGQFTSVPDESALASQAGHDLTHAKDESMGDSRSIQKPTTTKRKKQKRTKRRKSAASPKSKASTRNTALQVRTLHNLIADRIVVLSVRLVPLLIGLWLWRSFVSWIVR
jgi:ubiquitin-protein ligase